MGKKTEVTIAGKKYAIVGNDDKKYIEKIAEHVDKKMNELMKGNTELTQERAAVLAAINIADEYFKAEETAGNLRAEVGELIASMKGKK